jgi:Leucine-rich repeat (LRR) protein
MLHLPPLGLGNGLGQWLLRDGKEEGTRVVIPFLDTYDLLTMSLVSRKACYLREFITSVPLAPFCNDDDSSLFRFATCLRRLERLYLSRWSLMSDCFLGIRASDNQCLTTIDLSRMTLDSPCDISALYYIPRSIQTLLLPSGFPEPSRAFIEAIAQDACPLLHKLVVSPASLGRSFLLGVPKLKHLELRGADLYYNIFEDLYHCPNLDTLVLDRCGLHGRNDSFLAVLGSGRLTHLHTLVLTYHSYDIGGLEQVLSNGKLPALRHLSLAGSLVNDNTTKRVIAGVTNFAKLETVDLSYNVLNTSHIRLLTKAPRLCFRALTCLDLTATRLTVGAARVMANALVSAVNLIHLNISENVDLEDEGFALIVGALHHCPKLTQLDASCCSLDEKTASAMASYFTRPLTSIKSLNLSYNYCDHDGTVAAVVATLPPSTENLVLSRTLGGKRDVAALCARLSSGKMTNLTALDVQDNMLHPEEVLRIARAVGKTYCPNLKTLRL